MNPRLHLMLQICQSCVAIKSSLSCTTKSKITFIFEWENSISSYFMCSHGVTSKWYFFENSQFLPWSKHIDVLQLLGIITIKKDICFKHWMPLSYNHQKFPTFYQTLQLDMIYHSKSYFEWLKFFCHYLSKNLNY